MIFEIKIGAKYAVYLPKRVVDILGIKEGSKAYLYVEDYKIIIEPIPDPIELALKGKKYARISIEEIERVSIEEQEKYVSD